ncbi:putative inactive serine protease 37 [Gossypium arboreum]|uniref:Putative inactive serine protease 37 n=1 Tax=Gossypium arboreum TaxID=29729 RepID=A0A0B0NVR0_GOSAR|nr:putative inactive serine protease 37 [Gossypium arboreum]
MLSSFSSPLLFEHSLGCHLQESPNIMHALNPMEIPNLIAYNPARASVVNSEATSEWSTDFDAKISPSTSQTINPEADLKYYNPEPTAEELTLFACPSVENPDVEPNRNAIPLSNPLADSFL